MEYTDEEIMKLAKDAGLWGVEMWWWDDIIPKLRKFLELATKAPETDKKCECGNPEWIIGPCANCGGIPRAIG